MRTINFFIVFIALGHLTRAIPPQVTSTRPVRRAVIQTERRENPSLAGISAGRRIFRLLDETLEVDLTEQSDLVSGPARFYTGTVVGEEHSEVQILVTDDGVSGSVRLGGKILQVLAEGMGISQETEVDPSKFRDENSEIPSPPVPQKPSIYVHGTPFNSTQRQSSGTVVDWCAFYTAAALADAGGQVGMRNKIQAMEGDANTGYRNSGLRTRVRAVYDGEVNFDEDSSDWGRTLSAFKDTNDGKMDEVHGIREREGCDAMILLIAPTNDGSTAGIGYVVSRFDTMFSVSESRFAQSGVNAHEIGHNFGCAHDAATGGTRGLDQWSKGYINSAERVATVMAYTCSGCTALSVHSMPVTFDGVVVGNANDADCSRTISERTNTVSDFLPEKSRPSTPENPKNVPKRTEAPVKPRNTGVRDCKNRGPSKEGGDAATVRLSNFESYGVAVIFVDFNGKEQNVGTLSSSKSATLSTRIGHRIRFRNAETTDCVRSLVVRKSYREVVIGRS